MAASVLALLKQQTGAGGKQKQKKGEGVLAGSKKYRRP